MEECPYLSSIQAIPGRTPPEKYRELHRIASTISSNEEERVSFISSGISERVQPPLLPLLRILVGDRLKLPNFVVEALQSDDVSVIKRALNATWFFEAANLDVDFILNQIVPKIAPRTRSELVKVLAKSLKRSDDAPKKAEALFERFADSYGVKMALPLLLACGNEFIYRVAVKRRIELPSRLLTQLYRGGRSEAVLKYLRLGVKSDPENEEDRRAHKVDLDDYSTFVPVLVKHHLKELIKLYVCMPSYNYLYSQKLGHKRTELFLENAREVLIENPRRFLTILPLKLVTRKLTKEQFVSMYLELFPDKWDEYSINPMLRYLKYQPEHTKMQLFRSVYEQKYEIPFSLETVEKGYVTSDPLRNLLSRDEKEEWARNVLKNLENKQECRDFLHLLPPSECIPEMKESIKKLSDATERACCIRKMIQSCGFYGSKEDLTKVLEYYEYRHKNEQSSVLSEILNTIEFEFHYRNLEESQWSLLLNLASRAHMKNEDIEPGYPYFTRLFQKAINFYLKKLNNGHAGEETEAVLNKQIEISLEHCLANDRISDLVDCVDPELKKDYLTRLLNTIIRKYPEDHEVWKDDEKKKSISLCLLEEMNRVNAPIPIKRRRKANRGKQNKSTRSHKKNGGQTTKMSIKEYPWLRKRVVDVITSKTLSGTPNDSTVAMGRRKRRMMKAQVEEIDKFKRALRLHDLESYQSLIDDNPTAVNDVDTNDAWLLLKHNSNKVLEKWRLYLDVCRLKLSKGKKRPRNFLRFCKWYQDLPLKFVEQSLLDIKEPGSVSVLGILLDGETFSKITDRYHPKDDKLDSALEDAKAMFQFESSLITAMNYPNPPLPLNAIIPFYQGDYLPLVTTVIPGLVQRTPSSKTMAFVSSLIKMRVSVRKMGMRLIPQTACSVELRLFLENLHKTETNPSIRELVAKMIFHLFVKFPSLQAWELMKSLIESLNEEDTKVLSLLSEIRRVDRAFMAQYVQNFVNKLDSLEDDIGIPIISSIVQSLDKDSIYIIPEETLTILVERVFPKEVRFLIEVYVFSDPDQFQSRLSLLMKLLKNRLEKLDKLVEEPTPRLSRYYSTSFEIADFFATTRRVLKNNSENKMTLQFVDELLQFFSSTLEPYQDLKSYIHLRILKNFMECKDLEDLCKKLHQMTVEVIADFGTEYVISDIVEIFTHLADEILYHKDDSPSARLRITKLLMALDDKIGSLIGIELLQGHDVCESIKDEHDQIIQGWENSKYIVVRAALYGSRTTEKRYSIRK